MSKSKIIELSNEYRREELGKGIRGKYFEEFNLGTNIVLLDKDVAEQFDSEKSVNDALRSLIKLSRKAIKNSKHTSKNMI